MAQTCKFSFLSSIATADFMRRNLPLQSAAAEFWRRLADSQLCVAHSCHVHCFCIPRSLINCQRKLRWEKTGLKSQRVKRVTHDQSSSWLPGRGWRAFLLSTSHKAFSVGSKTKPCCWILSLPTVILSAFVYLLSDSKGTHCSGTFRAT